MILEKCFRSVRETVYLLRHFCSADIEKKDKIVRFVMCWRHELSRKSCPHFHKIGSEQQRTPSSGRMTPGRYLRCGTACNMITHCTCPANLKLSQASLSIAGLIAHTENTASRRAQSEGLHRINPVRHIRIVTVKVVRFAHNRKALRLRKVYGADHPRGTVGYNFIEFTG